MDALSAKFDPRTVMDRQAALAPGGARPLLTTWLGDLLERRWRWAAGLLGGIYLLSFNGLWRAEPDSALYLCVARNLAGGQGYTYHGSIETLAYPGLPVLLAATFKVFGSETLWPANLMMLVMGMIALALTYRLMNLYAGRRTAIIVTLGMAATKLFFRYCFQIMTDMPFLAGVLAVLCGFEALFGPQSAWSTKPTPSQSPSAPAVHRGRWYDWALIVLGMADVVTMRPTMLAFVPVVILVAIVTAWRRGFAWRVVGVVGLLLAGVAAFYRLDPRRAGVSQLDGYEQFVLSQFRNPTAEFLVVWQNFQDMLNIHLAAAMFAQHLYWLSAPVAIAILGVGMGLAARRPLWGLWVASTVGVMLLVLPHDRYVLAVLPLLEYAWWLILTWVNRKLPSPWANPVVAVLLLWQLLFNLSGVGGFMIEQRAIPFLDSHHPSALLAKFGRLVHDQILVRGYVGDPALEEMGRLIHDQVPPGAWVLAPAKDARVLSWYSGRRVVEQADLPSIDFSRQTLYVMIDPADSNSGTWERQQAAANHFTVLPASDNAKVDRPAPNPALKLHRCVPKSSGG
jgi:hypothetical protein